MKLSDYVVDFLVQHGVPDIFLVTGGGIMHLVDSVGQHPGMRFICNYHEQACAIAAEAYARTRNSVGACLVTTGPGSTNALSGIAGAFVDSIPVVVISGQVRRDLLADYSKLRQFGPQEINIDDMARPVVKYFKTVMDPASIRRELECAWHHATTGRPGPVWINIPLDVQAAVIEPGNLPGFEPPPADGAGSNGDLATNVAEAIRLLRAARRPVLIGGNGIHLGRARAAFARLVERVQAPVLGTIGGLDLMAEEHPLCMGRFGPAGQRRANFTLQNSDFLLSIGASMSVSSIGFNTAGFAPKARRVMVNVDPADLAKSNYRPHLGIATDAREFIEEFLRQSEGVDFACSPRWLAACAGWKERYPTITPDYLADRDHVNSYVFARALSDALAPGDVVVTGNSLDIVSVLHSFSVKPGQRVFTNINFGAMGWDLPAAVGACVGHNRAPVCLVTGDGTMQFNVQEMMTLRTNKLPVKMFVFNNAGYESIRSTQRNYFAGHFVGSDFASGIGNPNFRLLAAAYGFGYDIIQNNAELGAKLPKVLAMEGPVLCELNLSPEQSRSPKSMSARRPDGTFETRPLEDQFPFLPREELEYNMHLFDAEAPVGPQENDARNLISPAGVAPR
jgi:acetolactate synthase-1/2/3 large subunit